MRARFLHIDRHRAVLAAEAARAGVWTGGKIMGIRRVLAVLFIAAAPLLAFAQEDDEGDVTAVVPEPATLALLGAAVAAVAISRGNKRQ